ncbi:MAG: hydantoinase B/oxoprolinase family protein, partial [Alphaproteobacteria bacterium]|nr:hydantoinase B/oxoprolinase family protein [Alphaproteobacteria bacterium]
PETPVNHGSFMPIDVINPEGSFVNARLPAPCGGMVECRALLAGLMVGALGQAMPEKLVGDLKGGANHVYISGPLADGHGIYLCYEYPAGGTGASRGVDGSHAVRAFPEGDFNSVQSAEVIERQSPLRVERHGLREDSCGDGEFRGGLGLRREIRVLSAVGSLSVLSDKNVIPPFGVAAGGSGAPNRFTVVRDGAVIEPSPMPGKVGDFKLQAGDIVRMESSGGGGYGDPLERDPERVHGDVSLGYVTPEAARARFGVVLDRADGVDAAATRDLRDRMRAERVELDLQLSNADDWRATRRQIGLSSEVAARLGADTGDLIEVVTHSGVALRGWLAVDESIDTGALALGPDGLAALGAQPGDRVRLNRLRAAVS